MVLWTWRHIQNAMMYQENLINFLHFCIITLHTGDLPWRSIPLLTCINSRIQFYINYIMYKKKQSTTFTAVPYSADRKVVGFTTTCAISAYHHYSCEFQPRSWRGVLDTTLCVKVCQWLATGGGFPLVLRFHPPITLTATIYLEYCWQWR